MRRLLGNELMVRQDWLGILLIKKFVLEKKELCSEKKGDSDGIYAKGVELCMSQRDLLI